MDDECRRYVDKTFTNIDNDKRESIEYEMHQQRLLLSDASYLHQQMIAQKAVERMQKTRDDLEVKSFRSSSRKVKSQIERPKFATEFRDRKTNDFVPVSVSLHKRKILDVDSIYPLEARKRGQVEDVIDRFDHADAGPRLASLLGYGYDSD